MRNIVLILFILIQVIDIYAFYDMNENCRKAYGKIIRLNLDSGKMLLENEKKINPENIIPYYIENYIDFLIAVTGEEENAYSSFKENFPSRIDRLESGDKSSPYYKYCIAEVYFQMGLTKIKFQEYFSGFYELNKAYRLIESNRKEFPDFLLNLKTLGIMHILIGNIQENNSWIKTLLPYEATTTDGIKEIREILYLTSENEAYHYLRTECLFIYTYLTLNITRDNEKIPELLSFYYDPAFSCEINTNPFLQYSLAKIFINSIENDKAIEVLSSFKYDNNTLPFYYMDYLTARAKLNRLDKDSYKYFFLFIQNFKGIYYVKSTYQKLAWYYLVSGNNGKYTEYISKVLDHGTEIIEEDKQAQFEAESGILPNVKLLEARLSFDGGYYSTALEIMSEVNKTTDLVTLKDSLEYTYRLARIFHALGKISEAISLYQNTISMGSKQKYYYAANSALKLAQIYEKLKNFEQAEYYYRVCLKLNYIEYRNSISRDAKNGLRKLEPEAKSCNNRI